MSGDARQLANVLQDLEDIVKEGHVPRNRVDEVLAQGQQVKILLLEMQGVLDKYNGLNAQSRLAF